MKNVYVDLPVPAGNGTGAAQLIDQGEVFTVFVCGNFDGALYIQVSNDNSSWATFDAFTGAGAKTYTGVWTYMRVVTAGWRSGTPVVTVAAGVDSSSTDVTSLVVPPTNGVGAASDVTSYASNKRVILAGNFDGIMIIEASANGTDYVAVATATNSDNYKLDILCQKMRVRRAGTTVGTPTATVAALIDVARMVTVAVSLTAGQTLLVPHTLGVRPDRVEPSIASPIVVNSADSSNISVTNGDGSNPQTATFFVSITPPVTRPALYDSTQFLYKGSSISTGSISPTPDTVAYTGDQTIAAGATVVVPHAMGVSPDIVVPTIGSPLKVTARSASDITVNNPTTATHTANFMMVRQSTLIRSTTYNTDPYLWQGLDTSSALTSATSVNVKDYGAVGNGIHDDTLNIQAAIDAAVTLGISNIFVPPGTYKLTRQGVPQAGYEYCLRFTSTKKVRFWGVPGSILRFPSSTSVSAGAYAHACLLDSLVEITFDGLEFVGDTDNDLNTNINYGVMTYLSDSQVTVQYCRFTQCGPVQAAGNINTYKFQFLNNWIFDAPNALVCGSTCTIQGNFFINSSVVGTRSHAIYLYGLWEQATITGNQFYNLDKYAMKLKGNSASYQRKQGFQVTGNYANVAEGFLEFGSESNVSHCYATVTGNTTLNCISGVKIFAGYGGSITGNTVAYDWRMSPTAAAVGILVQSTNITTTSGDIAHTHDWDVGGNTIIADANFVAILQLNGQPAAGEQVVVGAETYTFVVGAPATPNEVQIGASVAATAENLAAKIQGQGPSTTYKMNDAIWEPKHAWATSTIQSPSQVFVNGMTTFTFTTTAANFVIAQAPTSYIDSVATGIRVYYCIAPVNIHDNHIFECQRAVDVQGCVAPIIRQNTAYGCKTSSSNPQVYFGRGNAFSIWENNTFRISPDSIEANVGRRFEIDDGFPVMRGNYGADTFAGGFMVKEYSGASGLMTCQSDGKAQCVLYYGYESFISAATAFNQNQLLRWSDGDTVVLNDNAGHVYTFTFKRTSPNAGALEFNTRQLDDGTHVSLMGLINATAEFAATSATRWNGAANTNEYSYVIIKRTTAGTAGNGATCTVTTRSQTCGQLLGNTQRAGTGTSLRKTRAVSFMGGAATAGTKTVIFSPLAGVVTAPVITPGNQACASLFLSTAGGVTGAFVLSTDSVPGVGWVLTHPTAAGTELFWYQTAN